MEYTFDLVKLHAQVRDVLPAKRSFSITFSVWDTRRRSGGLDVEVDIYDGEHHFRGQVPEEAVTALLRAYGEEEFMPEDLGTITIPDRVKGKP